MLCTLQTAIFEDFAGEAVHLCRQSLTTAAEKISLRPTASKLDGQLFVIRHLLILKEMVRSIDLVQVERAVDFSSVTGESTNIAIDFYVSCAKAVFRRRTFKPPSKPVGPLEPQCSLSTRFSRSSQLCRNNARCQTRSGRYSESHLRRFHDAILATRMFVYSSFLDKVSGFPVFCACWKRT